MHFDPDWPWDWIIPRPDDDDDEEWYRLEANPLPTPKHPATG